MKMQASFDYPTTLTHSYSTKEEGVSTFVSFEFARHRCFGDGWCDCLIDDGDDDDAVSSAGDDDECDEYAASAGEAGAGVSALFLL